MHWKYHCCMCWLYKLKWHLIPTRTKEVGYKKVLKSLWQKCVKLHLLSTKFTVVKFCVMLSTWLYANLILGCQWYFDEGMWYVICANAYILEKGGKRLWLLPIDISSAKSNVQKVAFLSVMGFEIIQAYKSNSIVLLSW